MFYFKRKKLFLLLLGTFGKTWATFNCSFWSHWSSGKLYYKPDPSSAEASSHSSAAAGVSPSAATAPSAGAASPPSPSPPSAAGASPPSEKNV